MSRTAPRVRVEALEDRTVPTTVGTLDPSFGTAGVTAPVAGRQFVAVAVQQDGKLVAVSDQGTDFYVTRFTAAGALDTTFGSAGTGVVTVDVGGAGQTDHAYDVAVDAANRVVVVGSGGASPSDFGLVRLSADGKTVDLNTHFHVGNATDGAVARAVAFQSDGTIVVAGDARVGTDRDFALARVDAATGAVVGTPATRSLTSGDDIGRGVAVVPAGAAANKVVVVGETGTAGNSAIGLVQFNADGSVDTTYNGGAGQKVIDPTTGNDTAAGVAVTAAGAVVVAGTNGAADKDLVAARLLPTGAFDPAFNGGAVRTITKTGNDFTENHPLALQSDGKIVVVGDSAAGLDVGVFRLNADGTTDTSFKATGDGTFDVSGNDDANAVAVDRDGRIVVAGDNGTSAGFLARLVGTVGQARTLAVGGSQDGKALLFDPAAGTGAYAVTGTAAAFGTTTADARVATADVNGDGVEDTILVTGPGTPLRLAVVSGADDATQLVAPFDPLGGDFSGGGFVSAADFDGDGRAEIVVTPDQGGGPRVVIFSLGTDGTLATRASFFGIDDAAFRGGARSGVGDVNGDGRADLAVAAGFQGGPRIALFNGTTVLDGGTPTRLVADFFAFEPGLRNGAYVSIGDINGDGFGDLLFGAGPGGSPRFLAASGQVLLATGADAALAAPLANFFVAGNSTDRGGVRTAAVDADGDNKADVVVGTGEGSASGVRVYLGKNLTTTAEPATVQDLNPYGAVPLSDGVFVG